MSLSALAGSCALSGWPVLAEPLQATEMPIFHFAFHPESSPLHLERHMEHWDTSELQAEPLEESFSPLHPSISEAAQRALACALPVVGYLGRHTLISLHSTGPICIHCPSVPAQHHSLATCTGMKLPQLSCKTGREAFAQGKANPLVSLILCLCFLGNDVCLLVCFLYKLVLQGSKRDSLLNLPSSRSWKVGEPANLGSVSVAHVC